MVQDIVLIDDGLFPVLLSLWDNFITNEGEQITSATYAPNEFSVIMGTRLKVVSHAGMSLATRSNSMVMVEPTIPRALELSTWGRDNMAAVKAALAQFNFTPWDQRMPTFRPIIATPIANVKERANKVSKIWVYAKARIIDTRQSFYQIACKECGQFIRASFGIEFNCAHCEQQSITVPRATFEIMLSDDSGSMMSLIEGEVAEQQFSFKANNLLQREIQGDDVIEQMINTASVGPKLMHLKAFNSNYHGTLQKRFRVTHVQDGLTGNNVQNENLTLDLGNNIKELKTPDTLCIAEVKKKAKMLSHCWVFAKTSILDTEQTFYKIACRKCGSSVNMLFGIEYTCAKCKKKSITVPRTIFEGSICDKSGSILALMEGAIAENHFAFKAYELLQKDIQGELIIDQVLKTLVIEPKLMQIQAFDVMCESSMETRFRVVDVYAAPLIPDIHNENLNLPMIFECGMSSTEAEASSSCSKKKLKLDGISEIEEEVGAATPTKLISSPHKGHDKFETETSTGTGAQMDVQ